MSILCAILGKIGNSQLEKSSFEISIFTKNDQIRTFPTFSDSFFGGKGGVWIKMDNTIRKIRKWATIGVFFVPLRPIYTWENLFEVFFFVIVRAGIWLYYGEYFAGPLLVIQRT